MKQHRSRRQGVKPSTRRRRSSSSPFLMRTITDIIFVFLLPSIIDVIQLASCDECKYEKGTDKYCIQQFATRGIQVATNNSKLDPRPGWSWDDLIHEDKVVIVRHTYFDCNTIQDSGKFLLIPDGVYATPIKDNTAETTATAMDSQDRAWSKSASGMGISGGISDFPLTKGIQLSMSGSYSKSSKEEKSDMELKKKLIVKGQLRFSRYQLDMRPNIKLEKTFEKRLLEIAIYLFKNKTEVAQYYAQELIRAYGTHYVTGITVGGSLNTKDSIDISSLEERGVTRDQVTKGGGFGVKFWELVDLKTDTENPTVMENSDGDETLIVNIKRTASYQGGPTQGAKNAETWVKFLIPNQKTIDRRGDFLNVIINTNTLPFVPESVVIETAQMVKSAIKEYYVRNAHVGCTDPTSENFDAKANVPDEESCKVNETKFESFPFGGLSVHIYGTKHMQDDDLWGDIRGFFGDEDWPDLHFDFGMWAKASSQYTDRSYVFSTHSGNDERLTIKALYPDATVSTDKGPWYGGIVDEKKECPFPYLKQPLYPAKADLWEKNARHTGGINVCVTVDVKRGKLNRKRWGGMYSCDQVNPYTSKQSCPEGYSANNIFQTQFPLKTADIDGDKQCDIIICEGDPKEPKMKKPNTQLNMTVDDAKHVNSESLGDLKSPPYVKRPNGDELIDKEEQEQIIQDWKDANAYRNEEFPVYGLVLIFFGCFILAAAVVLCIAYRKSIWPCLKGRKTPHPFFR